MLKTNRKFNCSGCSACKNICPKNAISMREDEKEFKYPYINQQLCIDCGLCRKVCPIINKKDNSKNKKSIAFAAINNDEKTRMDSSSGGIFSLIAENIIKKNGVVFGVAFNNEFLTMHKSAHTIEGLSEFRGAKYIQSDLKDTFKKVKSLLEEDRYVLFTGTPCQVEGLNNFLGKSILNYIHKI